MTEPAYLTEIRNSYNTVADAYHDLVGDFLAKRSFDDRPLERGMMTAFAQHASGKVAEIGCGTGLVTSYLAGLGLDIFGIDLSPEMVGVARRNYPDLRFEVGSMTGLDLPDGALGGVVSWYSIIHLPPEALPGVFAEFFRVLQPGGQLLLGFKAGDQRRHLSHAYGHDLSLDVYWLPLERVASLAEGAGFVEVARLERAPEEGEGGPQGYFLTRKP